MYRTFKLYVLFNLFVLILKLRKKRTSTCVPYYNIRGNTGKEVRKRRIPCWLPTFIARVVLSSLAVVERYLSFSLLRSAFVCRELPLQLNVIFLNDVIGWFRTEEHVVSLARCFQYFIDTSIKLLHIHIPQRAVQWAWCTTRSSDWCCPEIGNKDVLGKIWGGQDWECLILRKTPWNWFLSIAY